MPRILIVDDDLTVTHLLMALLSMEGYDPTTVSDSRKAMEVANQINPDLVMLDLMMPEVTGFEICELLRQDPKFMNVPIMIVSALDDPESRQKATQYGAKEYFTKPFDVNALLRSINELTSS